MYHRGRAALVQARRRKQRCYPELSGAHGRARLVVLAADVGGRWSEEARAFVSHLASAQSLLEKRPALECDGNIDMNLGLLFRFVCLLFTGVRSKISVFDLKRFSNFDKSLNFFD